MLNEDLFLQYLKTKDIEDRNRIVEKYLYVVDILVRKYLNKGVDYDDLYQVGSLALIKAAERFDMSRGFEFTSFATPTILGEIKRYFRDKGWIVKVPRRLKEISGKLQKSKEELSLKLQRVPTVKEIADYTGFSEEEILQADESNLAYEAFSLNQTFKDDENSGEQFEKFVAFEDVGFEAVENREIINNVLNKFSDTNRYIFRERFIEGRSQREIAEKLKVSQMTVSRAEKNIKAKFAEEISMC